ncbi:chemotaxis protein CheA [Sanguibacter hominis ATCC BAA-789]|uniref:histidine kinase n=1 Tax=Sanguibacter hominis ATCC BAA-789 TaxID=1312740 RepID=A0A9X5IS06_9MICO|nr:chemotaxis protein CheA [Sanguibacter hominis]NKX93574.1 chemotaxis protein CheA [Sanguibacter hominis ATCC BAA-789]
MDGVDEIVREFLIESYENLDQLDQDLIALESNPGSRELLSSIFRTIHTIKGTSGFLAFHKLESVTHVGEGLLVELRDGKREMDQPTTDVLLLMVDTVRAILAQIDADGSETGVETDAVVARIQGMLDAGPGAKPAAAAPVEEPAAEEPAPAEASAQDTDDDEDDEPEAVAEPFEVPAPVEDPAPKPAVGARKVVPRGARAATATATEAPVTGAPVTPAGNKQVGRTSESAPQRGSTAETSIRVDVDLLDELMRQVGELVLVRNQIAQITGLDANPELTRSSQRLSLIATELQEGVMKTRMQPIDHVWNKMPRVVRDLAAALKKSVDLEMIGGETELDRSLLESVKDPLTHLVRNAVDHGIEDPAGRAAAGKPENGVLTLRAYHAGGQVIVEVRDDGKGINPETVAAKALERGLKTVEQLDAMSINEIQSLVFLPGFSTASAVTNVSGRGVGMDVVRSNIEAIGGQVEVESEVGAGTVWRLRIPLTLAIMPALTVASGTEIYAIPQVNLLELVALDTERTAEAIEHVGNSEVYRLRGDLLPLVRLTDVLRSPSKADGSMVIAVLRADNQRFGLVVDRVMNNEEIVVKPLASQLKTVGTYAGATLMGDGRVALILDVQAIARRSLAGDSAEIAVARDRVEAVSAGADGQDLLIVAIDDARRAAVPLSAVTRLEQIDAQRIEQLGNREVLQYRGEILPVVRLDSILGGSGISREGLLDVVVFSRGQRSVALVVGEILEIVNDRGAERRPADSYGLEQLVVLAGKVTELVDLPLVLQTGDPEYFNDVVVEPDGASLLEARTVNA